MNNNWVVMKPKARGPRRIKPKQSSAPQVTADPLKEKPTQAMASAGIRAFLAGNTCLT
jgi:hypothetical protein